MGRLGGIDKTQRPSEIRTKPIGFALRRRRRELKQDIVRHVQQGIELGLRLIVKGINGNATLGRLGRVNDRQRRWVVVLAPETGGSYFEGGSFEFGRQTARQRKDLARVGIHRQTPRFGLLLRASVEGRNGGRTQGHANLVLVLVGQPRKGFQERRRQSLGSAILVQVSAGNVQFHANHGFGFFLML